MREDYEKFEDIPAWQEALHLTTRVYEHTTDGGWAVDDILRGEIRTNAINIATKIAQGHAKQDVLEFRKMVSTARSLTSVVKTHLYIAMELDYLDQKGFDAVNAAIESTRGMIDFLLDGLKRASGRRSSEL